jgi:hypothetical protein
LLPTGKLAEPKLSDLKAMIVNTGGRKARPYRRLANPQGRGGVYLPAMRARRGRRVPARRDSTDAVVPLQESLNLGRSQG